MAKNCINESKAADELCSRVPVGFLCGVCTFAPCLVRGCQVEGGVGVHFGQLSSWRNINIKILKQLHWNHLQTHNLVNFSTIPAVPLAGLRESFVSSLVMLRGRERVFLAEDRPWLVDFCCCWSTLSKSSMILSCCRRAYSPRVKSPRRAGVAGGVGEGEVVPTGGVLEGDAILLCEESGLKSREILLFSALDLVHPMCKCKEPCMHQHCAGALINVLPVFPFLLMPLSPLLQLLSSLLLFFQEESSTLGHLLLTTYILLQPQKHKIVNWNTVTEWIFICKHSP